jgi:hypothetical protein
LAADNGGALHHYFATAIEISSSSQTRMALKPRF